MDFEKIKAIAICDAFPEDLKDYFYSSNVSLYSANVISAFQEVGLRVKTIGDIIDNGVYLTVAVKEPRKGLTVPSNLIEKHSADLERELSAFPNVKAIILMGDTAIKAFNLISKRTLNKKTIPSGSTYKIRKEKFYFKNIRVFPSYLPTGQNFLIEKSKRRMVVEDIKNALK